MNRSNKALIIFLFCQVIVFNTIRAQEKHRDQTFLRRVNRFEKSLVQLQKILHIPGLSVAIVKDKKVIWARGYGYADIGNKVPATPSTLYHVASLTKTMASELIFDLVSQGKIDLEEPMSRYSSFFKDDSIRVKHLLSHTSSGERPGKVFMYNGFMFSFLTNVIERASTNSFRDLVIKKILDPLKMAASIPGQDVLNDSVWNADSGSRILSYKNNLHNLAKPYTLYDTSEIVDVPYPPLTLSASAGILSTVLDWARYDSAIDSHFLLTSSQQKKAWTNFTSITGEKLPYGYGWYVESYKGTQVIWHYGNWGTGFSSNYIKIPSLGLTLIIFANSESLSEGFFENGKAESSPFVASFLNEFSSSKNERLKVIDWRKSLSTNSTTNYELGEGLASLRQRLEQSKTDVFSAESIADTCFKRFTGKYKPNNSSRVFTVWLERGKLYINMPRYYTSEMFAIDSFHFRIKTSLGHHISFLATGKPDIFDLIIEMDSDRLVATRLPE